jgi:hypothetical protein
MRDLEDVRRGTARRPIPTASKAGLAVIGLGLFADLIAHVDVGFARADTAMTGAQLSAHLVIFLGMVLVLVGVVIDGLQPSRRVYAVATQGRHRHAVR